jgi:hypothetical protein
VEAFWGTLYVVKVQPPRYIVWSTNEVDLNDPFQCRWYIRQVLLYGREQDVRQLDKAELATLIDELRLPEPIYQLWKRYLYRAGYYAN